jgi:hypothetical protein
MFLIRTRQRRFWLFIAVMLWIKSFTSGEETPGNFFPRRRSNHESFEKITAPRILVIKSRRSRYQDVDIDRAPLCGKLWPPWPFNLIGRSEKVKDSNENVPATSSRFIAYLRQSSRIGIRQIQQRKLLTV